MQEWRRLDATEPNCRTRLKLRVGFPDEDPAPGLAQLHAGRLASATEWMAKKAAKK